MRIRKIVRRLWLPLLFLALLAIIPAEASEVKNLCGPKPDTGKYWCFKAEATTSLYSSVSDQFNGIFQVRTLDGKQHEAFRVSGEQLISTSERNKEDLIRLIDPVNDERKYVELPLEIKKHWEATYFYSAATRADAVRTTMTYTVTGEETIQIPAGVFKTFVIVGTARLVYPGKYPGLVYFRYHKLINHYSPEMKIIVHSYLESASGAGIELKREVELIEFGFVR